MRALTCLWMVRILAIAAPQQPAANKPVDPAFGDFTTRVQQYTKLQKTVPRPRSAAQSGQIVEYRQELARKLQVARSGAKQGDMFTPDISEAFQRVISSVFQGPDGPKVRKTIRQGNPVLDWHPTVNDEYPEALPLTTVPPTLLLQLPTLPRGIAYQIVGHDLVLEDTEARLVIDFIPGALP